MLFCFLKNMLRIVKFYKKLLNVTVPDKNQTTIYRVFNIYFGVLIPRYAIYIKIAVHIYRDAVVPSVHAERVTIGLSIQ